MPTPEVLCSCCGKPIIYTTGVTTPLRWVYLASDDEIVGWIDPADDKSLCIGCVTDMAQLARHFKENIVKANAVTLNRLRNP